ncbi:Na+-translocating ferredoxin:NAD+ oxidoreductase RNF, RnfE subunit [Deferribacterales bacterium RsTz2092]|nr:electron transport complex subunit E [Deferribacterales bacterium]
MLKQALKTLREGIFDNNPTLKQYLGMCPALAVSTSVANALGMGLATTAALVVGCTSVSIFKNSIPRKIRLPVYLVMISGLVTVIQLLMNAYWHGLYKMLGIFIPLIVINCIMLFRSESFALKNGVFISFVDALANGLGFTLALVLMGAIREIVGNGTLLGAPIVTTMPKTLIFLLPPGGFLVVGFLVAGYGYIYKKIGGK